jgi:putative ABC transport system ATP-binding protein
VSARAALAESRAGVSVGEVGSGSAWTTVRRGLALSPQIRDGLPVTLLLALVATAGRVVVPVAVQQTIDRGFGAATGTGVDVGFVTAMVVVAAGVVALTMVSAFVMNARLFRASEAGLAALRVRAFRHVHDLSVQTQSTERRGSLVSRVTSDVDSLSLFLQWAGVFLLVATGQVLLASAVMVAYSWQLALVVWVSFLPLVLALRVLQRHLARAYLRVRERVGAMLGAISEAVVGAEVVRAYGIEQRTGERIDAAIEAHRSAATRAQAFAVGAFSTGELVSGVATAGVVVVGVLLGLAGEVTAGRLVAFLFLVTLFVQPVQLGTEMLNEMQNAIASWRRVLGVVDTPPDVADPGADGRGVALPHRPVDVEFDAVTYAYPGGPPVLSEVCLTIPAGQRVAVVGETGSGKSTFVKLLTRLMDPTRGVVRLDGVDLREVRFDSLRARVVLVPQEGFLFDDTLAANLRYGRPDATDAQVLEALADLGLDDWALGLPQGLATRVGQRGESLSVGERQLVALARARLADPDLLVLDEATSAVDPATEVRLARALRRLSAGRTSVTIAHRMSTAEAADRVLVFDAGRLVQDGTHEHLRHEGAYARLHAAWSSRGPANAGSHL